MSPPGIAATVASFRKLFAERFDDHRRHLGNCDVEYSCLYANLIGQLSFTA